MTAATGTAAGSATLARRTAVSVLWVAGFHLLRAAVFASMVVVLARYGGATDVGLGEWVFALYFVLTPFVEAGTGPAIVQRPSIDDRFLGTALVTNAVAGASTSAIVFLGAGPAVGAADIDPRLAPLLRGLAPSLFVLALAVVPQSLLARRMAFGAITRANVLGTVIAAVVTVAGVRRGLGAGAIVAGLFAYACTTAVGCWVACGWRPRWQFDRRLLRDLVSFGLPIASARLVGAFGAHLERFLIGGLLGSTTLGLYGVARNLARTPFLQLMQVSDRVLLPALSELQHDLAASRDYYVAAVRNELALVGPLVVLVGALAHDLVPIVYGPGWDRAVPLVWGLAFITVRTTTNHTAGAVFLAPGAAVAAARLGGADHPAHVGLLRHRLALGSRRRGRGVDDRGRARVGHPARDGRATPRPVLRPLPRGDRARGRDAGRVGRRSRHVAPRAGLMGHRRVAARDRRCDSGRGAVRPAASRNRPRRCPQPHGGDEASVRLAAHPRAAANPAEAGSRQSG